MWCLGTECGWTKKCQKIDVFTKQGNTTGFYNHVMFNFWP